LMEKADNRGVLPRFRWLVRPWWLDQFPGTAGKRRGR